MKPLLLLALLSMAGLAAAQDKVYRCGQSYSAQPCPGAREVDTADPRSAGQQREAAHTAQREAALADQLARERRARERATRGQKAASLGGARPPEPPASASQKGKKKKKGRPGDPSLSDPVRAPA